MNAQRKENQPKWAVVLCGGRGSRLGMHTHNLPKSLVDIAGKPILGYIFEELIKYGYNRIILPVGYLGEQIAQFSETYPFPAGTECHVRETGVDTPIGSRLAQVRHLLPNNDDFLLVNGDLIFDFNLADFLQVHRRNQLDITFASATIHSPFGLLIHQDGKLTGFTRDEKIQSFNTRQERKIGLIYAGICMMNTRGLDYGDISQCENFEAEIFPEIIRMGKAGHFAIEGFWHPVDTPKDLASVVMLLNYTRGNNE